MVPLLEAKLAKSELGFPFHFDNGFVDDECRRRCSEGIDVIAQLVESLLGPTEWMECMSHRKRRETKQQPSMLLGPAVPGCCLVSFHFLCDIH